jgi:hypothetical protein
MWTGISLLQKSREERGHKIKKIKKKTSREGQAVSVINILLLLSHLIFIQNIFSRLLVPFPFSLQMTSQYMETVLSVKIFTI